MFPRHACFWGFLCVWHRSSSVSVLVGLGVRRWNSAPSISEAVDADRADRKTTKTRPARQMHVTVSTDIDRPLAGVWHWYAIDHVRNHPRWDPDMELEQISDGPIGLGTTIRRRNRHFDEPIEGEMEIIEWEPERVMAVRIHDANTDTVGRVTFDALGPSRTRLTIEADFPDLDASKVDHLRPLMERTASNVRRLVESEVAPGAR
jgi:hypothetical protein